MDHEFHRRGAARGLAVAILAGIALVHALEAPDKFEGVPYQGGLFVALIAAALVTAAVLVRSGHPLAWMAAAPLAALPLIFFVVSRTFGLPGDSEDIGAWGEFTGIASLVLETAGIVVAVMALRSASRRAPLAAVLRFPERTPAPAERRAAG